MRLYSYYIAWKNLSSFRTRPTLSLIPIENHNLNRTKETSSGFTNVRPLPGIYLCPYTKKKRRKKKRKGPPSLSHLQILKSTLPWPLRVSHSSHRAPSCKLCIRTFHATIHKHIFVNHRYRSAYLPSARNTALSTYDFAVGDTARVTFPRHFPK